MKYVVLSFLTFGVAVSISSCTKDNAVPEPTEINLTDSITIPFRSDHYSFYSLETGKEVALEDSASTKWDIGLRFASIIVNSHASGPGDGGIVVMKGVYEDFNKAPDSGYGYDTTTSKLAVNSNPRSEDAWYLYEPVNHNLSPKAGLFFVVKTANGRYAKLEVMKVEYVGWDPGAGDVYPDSIKYKFRYTYQSNGTTQLGD